MATVGYGDVLPGNSPEKLLAMAGMALGVTLFAYFMGAITSVLDTLNTNDAQVGWGGGLGQWRPVSVGGWVWLSRGGQLALGVLELPGACLGVLDTR
jgi:hypothetical protein